MHKLVDGKRPGIGIPGIAAAAGRMIVRERPMLKIQIDMIQLQILQAFLAGAQYLPVHIVPYL